MAADTKNLPEVLGYLAWNWPDCNADNPAVMLNPSAQPLDLLAWCWGELMSLTAVADALVAGDAEHCGDVFGPVFVQRLPAVRDVLEHAVNRLYAERASMSADSPGA